MPFPGRTDAVAARPAGSSALLNWDDLDAVLALLAEVAPRWSAELNHGAPDESTIVVLPEGANDLLGPAFVLHRGEDRVYLDQFRWDEYRKLGGFLSLEHALASLRTRLLVLTTGRALADQPNHE